MADRAGPKSAGTAWVLAALSVLGVVATAAGAAGLPGALATVALLAVLLWGVVALSHRTERSFQRRSDETGHPVFAALWAAQGGELSMEPDALRFRRGRKRVLAYELPWSELTSFAMTRKGRLGSVAVVQVTAANGGAAHLEVTDGPPN